MQQCRWLARTETRVCNYIFVTICQVALQQALGSSSGAFALQVAYAVLIAYALQVAHASLIAHALRVAYASLITYASFYRQEVVWC